MILDDSVLSVDQYPDVRAARRHVPTHAAADPHVAEFEVSVRYAFAKARKAIPRDAIRKALSSDPKKVAGLMKPALDEMRAALTDVLPKVVRKCVVGGGEVATSQVNRLVK